MLAFYALEPLPDLDPPVWPVFFDDLDRPPALEPFEPEPDALEFLEPFEPYSPELSMTSSHPSSFCARYVPNGGKGS